MDETETEESPGPATLLSGAHWNEPAQNNFDDLDADSALGEQLLSTASISSTIFKYRTIHGRTYHSDNGNAQYWAANDEKHNEAADINHHVQTLGLDGKLFLAPIENPQLVVDIGTGTGIWAVDFADNFPESRVIGTDVSPNQPNWVPPNVEFQIDDCTQEWTFASNSIDYIHIRFLSGSIVDWYALFREAYRCLKPGGYIESMEPWPYIQSDDDSIAPGSALSQWGPLFIEAGIKMGRPFTIAADGTQRAAIQAAGFVDLQEQRYKCPLGVWPEDPKMRELGTYSYAVLDQDMEGILLFVANKIHGWSQEQIQVFSSHMRREMRSGKHHAWYWQSVIWARKPT